MTNMLIFVVDEHCLFHHKVADKILLKPTRWRHNIIHLTSTVGLPSSALEQTSEELE